MSEPLPSTPSNHPHDTAADIAAPQPQSPDLQSDITDELTDHLALAARDLQLAGHSADESHQLAHQKFGDVATIRRRLWWIHKGDEVMLRTAFALVLVVLFVAVAALGIGGWRINEKLDDLGATLVAMSQSNSSIAAPENRNTPIPQITGICFVGDRSQPATNIEVKIYGHPKRQLVRRVLTNDRGAFSSGTLSPGTYTVIAPLLGESNPMSEYSYGSPSATMLEPVYRVESGLLDVYSKSAHVQVELDLNMIPVGDIRFELAGPFPKQFDYQADNYNYAVNVKMALLIAHDVPSLPVENPIMDIGAKSRTIGPFYNYPSKERWFDARDLSTSWATKGRTPLPAGTYKVGAYVRAEARPNGARYPYDFRWALVQLESLNALIDVEVKAGQRAIVRITPPDPTDEYREAITKFDKLEHSRRENSDNQEISRRIDEATDQLYKTRPAKLAVVGYTPLESAGE